METVADYILPYDCSLGLKVVHPGGVPESSKAPKGFKWNLTLGGWTVAPDWDPTPRCGGGLHLWEWAQGDLRASKVWHKSNVVWLAVEYKTYPSVNLGGKVKVPRCKTVAVGSSKEDIVQFIRLHTPPVEEGLFFFDRKETDKGLYLCVGDGGTAIVGDGGYAVAGMGGTAIAGDRGTALSGWCGSAVVGDSGEAEVYYDGSGCGKAKAGTGGKIVFRSCYGNHILQVGENGIKPDTFYTLEGDFPKEIQKEASGILSYLGRCVCALRKWLK